MTRNTSNLHSRTAGILDIPIITDFTDWWISGRGMAKDPNRPNTIDIYKK